MAGGGSTPGWSYTYVPTAAEWNTWWSNKQDYLNLSTPTLIALQTGVNAANGVPALNSSGQIPAAQVTNATGTFTVSGSGTQAVDITSGTYAGQIAQSGTTFVLTNYAASGPFEFAAQSGGTFQFYINSVLVATIGTSGVSSPAYLASGVPYANRPSSPVAGMIVTITDATVNTVGATISAGSGAYTVLAWYNGSAWKVAAV